FEGIVKNITDYGAFIDLGGVDGLLHVTDMAWRRISHPSEILAVGDQIKVQVVRFNSETQRISLGIKQLESDPWSTVEQRFPVGTKLSGRITNVTDYGAFVELADGIEGLVHISEMSWTKTNLHPGKLISPSQTVDVQVLEVDIRKRRISLGMKQCMENPCEVFAREWQVDQVIEGMVRNVTDFGVFVRLTDDIDGLVHESDLSWETHGSEALKSYKKGDMVKVKILDIDCEKQRVGLGVKQLEDNPILTRIEGFSKNDVVTCTVKAIAASGIEVVVGSNDTPGFIRRSDLARDRGDQRTDRFAEGEKIDARIITVDRKFGKLSLSIKAHEMAEEKKAMEAYGTSNAGASLGDILGAALEKHQASTGASDATDGAEGDQEKTQPDALNDREEQKIEPKEAKTSDQKRTSSAKKPAKKAASAKAKAAPAEADASESETASVAEEESPGTLTDSDKGEQSEPARPSS
ncbi:MAG: S1 RNA-binding domain-containing protein, partial [Pseudomonadota bacterium]